ncbi:unnamed protein product [Gongylonema pulchrum]|uniref:Fibrous sheath-interacting protein 1 n=1 Tax=Gongylonema pulchrum TaxID=637853 RepID=A0A183EIM9_9BILA|nr:unnamed protein product [Gongylonema pulchrum]
MASAMKVKESPWCRQNNNDEPVVSFEEIMSLELAEQLEEEDAVANGIDPSIAQYGISPSDLAQCKDDLELAQKLQDEFDREYQMSIKQPEEKNVKGQLEIMDFLFCFHAF